MQVGDDELFGAHSSSYTNNSTKHRTRIAYTELRVNTDSSFAPSNLKPNKALSNDVTYVTQSSRGEAKQVASDLDPTDSDTNSRSGLDESTGPKVGLPCQPLSSMNRPLVGSSESPVLVDCCWDMHFGWSRLSSESLRWFACTLLA